MTGNMMVECRYKRSLTVFTNDHRLWRVKGLNVTLN